jgi:O-antigen ligase
VRLLIWQAGLAMAHDHPFFGVGLDQFLYYYDPRYTAHPYLIATQNGHPTAAASDPHLSHPHNLGLELWLSAGIAGLIGFWFVVVAALARGWASLASGFGQRAAGGWRSPLVAGLLAALIVSLVNGLVDSAYFQPDLALGFWGMVAALLALSVHYRVAEPHDRAAFEGLGEAGAERETPAN